MHHIEQLGNMTIQIFASIPDEIIDKYAPVVANGFENGKQILEYHSWETAIGHFTRKVNLEDGTAERVFYPAAIPIICA